MRWGVGLLYRGAAVLAVSLAGSLAGCASAPPQPSIVGLWLAEEVAGAPVASDAEPVLQLKTAPLRVRDTSQRRSRASMSIAFGVWKSGRITLKVRCRQRRRHW